MYGVQRIFDWPSDDFGFIFHRFGLHKGAFRCGQCSLASRPRRIAGSHIARLRLPATDTWDFDVSSMCLRLLCIPTSSSFIKSPYYSFLPRGSLSESDAMAISRARTNPPSLPPSPQWRQSTILLVVVFGQALRLSRRIHWHIVLPANAGRACASCATGLRMKMKSSTKLTGPYHFYTRFFRLFYPSRN